MFRIFYLRLRTRHDIVQAICFRYRFKLILHLAQKTTNGTQLSFEDGENSRADFASRGGLSQVEKSNPDQALPW
jgi:hypothetical protein